MLTQSIIPSSKVIRKFAEKEDIDKVVAENFDMYWNFMVSIPSL